MDRVAVFRFGCLLFLGLISEQQVSPHGCTQASKADHKRFLINFFFLKKKKRLKKFSVWRSFPFLLECRSLSNDQSSIVLDQTTSPITLPWQSPVYWAPELKVRDAQSNLIVTNGLCSVNFSNPFLNTFTLLLHMTFCSSNAAVIK